mgnify:FL=1
MQRPKEWDEKYERMGECFECGTKKYKRTSMVLHPDSTLLKEKLWCKECFLARGERI